MASETDFLDMYRTLGLRPGCALPEFKQAFRRHVARMHPDRKGEAPVDPVSASSLQRLIAQYDAAMAFQREHGRLPGSTTRVRFAVPEAAAPVAPLALGTRPRQAWRQPLLALLLSAVALAVLGWELASRPPTPASSATAPSDDDEVRPLGSIMPAPSLSRGMSRDEVRTMLGDPVSVNGARWEYGPSWVRFEDGEVVDWYSSPLHSLGATPRTPDTSPLIPPDSNR